MLNGATYEWEHHAPILKDEGGLSEGALKEVRERKAWQGWGSGAESLEEKQRAALAYADAMSIGIKVNDEIFAWLKRLFNDEEVVEITATVAAYHCVSRFLVALDVDETNEREIKA